jgi:hypothetical protein
MNNTSTCETSLALPLGFESGTTWILPMSIKEMRSGENGDFFLDFVPHIEVLEPHETVSDWPSFRIFRTYWDPKF